MGVETNKQIKLQIIIDTLGKSTIKNLKNLMTKLGASTKKVSSTMKKFSSTLNEVNRPLKKINNSMNKTSMSARHMRGAMLGFGLSTMFAGMALQRFAGGFLRSLFVARTTIGGATTQMEKNVTALSASFAFLKFSIFNALEGTIVENFILTVIEKFNELADFFGNNPSFASSLVSTMGVLFAVGAGTAVMGQILTFLTGTSGVIPIWESVFGAGGEISTIMGSFSAWITPWLTYTISFKYALDALESLTEGDLVGALSSGFTTGGLFAFAKGKGKLAGALITASIGLKFVKDLVDTKDLATALESIGNEVALLGVVSSDPWVIAIGIIFKFLEPLEKLGKKIYEGATKNLLGPDKSLFKNMLGVVGVGVGGALSFPNELVKGTQELLSGKIFEKQTEGLTNKPPLMLQLESLRDTVIPSTNTKLSEVTKKIDAMKESDKLAGTSLANDFTKILNDKVVPALYDAEIAAKLTNDQLDLLNGRTTYSTHVHTTIYKTVYE